MGIVVCACLLQQLVYITLRKEGFQVEPEERLTPEVFSYNLLRAVKGPIQRLGTQLTDISVWKDRIEAFNMTPVELARRHLKAGASGSGSGSSSSGSGSGSSGSGSGSGSGSSSGSNA